MTPRILLVAVCCLRNVIARSSSLEQPHVLDGDHGLIGKGFKQLDLRRGEGAYLVATCGQYSNEFPLLTKGNGQEGAPVAEGTQRWEFVLRADVRNVERAMLAHPAILWLIRTDLDAAKRYGTEMSPHNHSVPVAESQQHIIDPTNPRGAFDDRIEDRLHIRGRPADDAEHLGRCRLMLQGLAQFALRSSSSLNSRTFSMAMTAWLAKVLSNSICLSEKGRTSIRQMLIAPIAVPSLSIGSLRMSEVPGQARA